MADIKLIGISTKNIQTIRSHQTITSDLLDKIAIPQSRRILYELGLDPLPGKNTNRTSATLALYKIITKTQKERKFDICDLVELCENINVKVENEKRLMETNMNKNNVKFIKKKKDEKLTENNESKSKSHSTDDPRTPISTPISSPKNKKNSKGYTLLTPHTKRENYLFQELQKLKQTMADLEEKHAGSEEHKAPNREILSQLQNHINVIYDKLTESDDKQNDVEQMQNDLDAFKGMNIDAKLNLLNERTYSLQYNPDQLKDVQDKMNDISNLLKTSENVKRYINDEIKSNINSYTNELMSILDDKMANIKAIFDALEEKYKDMYKTMQDIHIQQQQKGFNLGLHVARAYQDHNQNTFIHGSENKSANKEDHEYPDSATLNKSTTSESTLEESKKSEKSEKASEKSGKSVSDKDTSPSSLEDLFKPKDDKSKGIKSKGIEPKSTSDKEKSKSKTTKDNKGLFLDLSAWKDDDNKDKDEKDIFEHEEKPEQDEWEYYHVSKNNLSRALMIIAEKTLIKKKDTYEYKQEMFFKILDTLKIKKCDIMVINGIPQMKHVDAVSSKAAIQVILEDAEKISGVFETFKYIVGGGVELNKGKPVNSDRKKVEFKLSAWTNQREKSNAKEKNEKDKEISYLLGEVEFLKKTLLSNRNYSERGGYRGKRGGGYRRGRGRGSGGYKRGRGSGFY